MIARTRAISFSSLGWFAAIAAAAVLGRRQAEFARRNPAGSPLLACEAEGFARCLPSIPSGEACAGRAGVELVLRDAAVAMDVLYAFNGNSYAGARLSTLRTLGLRMCRNVSLEVVRADAAGFELRATSREPGAASAALDSAARSVLFDR